MDSLQTSIWTVQVGFSNSTANKQITDYCAKNVWHAYKLIKKNKYFEFGPDSVDIQATWACLFYIKFDSYSILPTDTELILNQLTLNTDAHLHFVNDSRAKQETNMWSSSIEESRNGTWSVNIRVSVTVCQ